MNKTTHYQLNQWDGEDRIMRPDFNRDNSIIDQALHDNAQATAAEEAARKSAVTAEANARSQQDTAIRGELATAVAGAKSEAASALKTEQTTRSNQDAAIRKEFAAADTQLRSENMLVKLMDITTTADKTRIDVNVSSIDWSKYVELIFIPYLISANSTVYVRLNNITTTHYQNQNNSSQSFLVSFNSSTAMLQKIRLSVRDFVFAYSDHGSYGYILQSAVSPDTLTTVNFVGSAGGTLSAGSRILVYGLKK